MDNQEARRLWEEAKGRPAVPKEKVITSVGQLVELGIRVDGLRQAWREQFGDGSMETVLSAKARSLVIR